MGLLSLSRQCEDCSLHKLSFLRLQNCFWFLKKSYNVFWSWKKLSTIVSKGREEIFWHSELSLRTCWNQEKCLHTHLYEKHKTREKCYLENVDKSYQLWILVIEGCVLYVWCLSWLGGFEPCAKGAPPVWSWWWQCCLPDTQHGHTSQTWKWKTHCVIYSCLWYFS